jgi:CheY-like chemotaxis protein
MIRHKTSAPAHVLVVEDHDDSRDLLRQMLEHGGLRVSEASTAEQAVALADATTFDAVITDVSLTSGTRDGIWLLKRLQAHPRNSHAPVIAVTGRKERQMELSGRGFFTVMMKPIEILQLGAVIRGAMGR